MADYCKIRGDKLLVYRWDSDRRGYVGQRAQKGTVWTHLRIPCRIAPETTLLDIFRMVASYKLLTALVSQYSWCRCIDEFHAQAEEPMRGEDRDVEYLEIYWHTSCNQYSETKKHPGGVRERTKVVAYDAQPMFHGVGKAGMVDYREDGRELYSVSYTPMYDLADLPVKLKEEFTIYTPLNLSRKKGEQFKQPEELLKAKRTFTLLDVLDAIYDDISFHGGPAENAEFIEELKGRAQEIQDGVADAVPIDELFDDLDA